jgi:hypothetical protein
MEDLRAILALALHLGAKEELVCPL